MSRSSIVISSILGLALASLSQAQVNLSVTAFGARADGILRTDGAMNAGSSILTSAAASFTAADNGKYIQVIGAGPGGSSRSDATMAQGSAVVNSPSGGFNSADVGRGIIVIGAGASAGNLVTTIASFTSNTSVVLNAPALTGTNNAFYYYGAMTLEGTVQSIISPTSVLLSSSAASTITGATYAFGTDNHAAFQTALDTAGQAGGGTVNVPLPALCPSGAVCGYVVGTTDQMTAHAPGAIKIRYNNVSLIGAPQTNLFCRGAWATYSNSAKFPNQTATIRGNCIAVGDDGAPRGVAGEFISNVTISNLHLYGMTNGNTRSVSYSPTDPPLTTTGDGWDETHKGIYLWENSALSNIVIDSVYIQDFKGENIYSGGSVMTGIIIRNSTMTNFNGDGISMLAADLQVLNNTITNGSNAGIENSSKSTTSAALVRQLYQGNTIADMPREGLVVVGVDSGVATGSIQILNNYFDRIAQSNRSGAQSAIYLAAQNGGNNIAPSNVTISGNTCHDCFAFGYLGTSGTTLISNNTIIVDQMNGDTFLYFTFPMTNLTISNNTGYRTAAAAGAGRKLNSVYTLNPGYANGNFAWNNVLLQNNSWNLPGTPHYMFVTTSGPGWSLVTAKNLIWQNDVCSGCTYTDINHGVVNLAATTTVEPYGPIVYVNGNSSPVTATLDASKELDGSEVQLINSGAAPVIFNSDHNLTLASPVTLNPGGGSVIFHFNGGTGTFSVKSGTSISVVLTPAAAVLGVSQTAQFSAAVAGTSNQQVTWSIAPAGVGAISSSGLYTAPASVASAQTVTVQATSIADPTKLGTATIALTAVAVSMSPTSATVGAGQTQQLTATVAGTTNQQVAWTMSPAGTGTVSNTGLYAPPASISAQQTLTVTATSAADPGKSASSTITLSMVAVSLNLPSPALGGGQSQQFTASVTGVANQQVNWSILPAGMGSISAAGFYLAPALVNAQQTVTVQATSAADPTKSASRIVTLNPVSLSITPVSATLVAAQAAQFGATVSWTNNPKVNWSISPAGAGSISAAGLYTAPATLSASQTVTLTAASQADATKVATASITLNPGTVNPPTGYAYQRAITVAHGQVSTTDQSNFPVLIKGVYPFLATTANGGHVQNANGYDIAFSSDSAATHVLNSEIESYDPVTGTVSIWVQAATVSHTADTVLYMSYGNPAIVSLQGNRKATWDNSFAAVYHMSENAATGAVGDSSSNANTGTAQVNTSVNSTVGAAGAGLRFNGASDYVNAGQSSSVSVTGPVTVEGWVNLASWPRNGYGGYLVAKGQQYFLEFTSDNAGSHGIVAGTYYGSNSFSGTAVAVNSAFTGAFHHVAATWDGVTWSLYIDGALKAQSASALGPALSSEPVTIGGQTFGGGTPFQFLNGILDEVRVSSSPRSAGWIATEYNNLSQPMAFYTVGTEQTGSTTPPPTTITVTLNPPASSLTAGQTLQLSASVAGTANQQVTWSVSGGGSVSSSGLYTAPAPVPAQQTSIVTATSAADATKSASAVITVNPAVSISVSVSLNPSTGSITAGQTLQLAASVAGTANQQVTWSVSGGGSVSSSGLYTAPAPVPAQQTSIVTATSAADPTKSASAAITVNPAASISVSLNPPTGSITAGQTLQLAASVAGTTNQQVTWSVSGGGSVSSSGLYTAPASVPAQQTSIVKATSALDPTKTATAAIVISPAVLTGASCGAPGQNSWTGCYYQDLAFATLGLTRADPYIQFNWPANTAIGNGVGPQNFSAQWQGNFGFQYSWYYFYITADDTVRIYVDGAPIFDSSTASGASPYRIPYLASAGTHLVRVEYVHHSGAANINIAWGSAQ